MTKIALPSPYEPLVDNNGKINEIWYRYLNGANVKLNSVFTATTIDGLPSTANLVDGDWGVFRDSSLGSIRLAYNNNSTIVSVALTT
jgi:hypothetical protein